MDEAWETSEQQCFFFGNRKELNTKYFQFFKRQPVCASPVQ